MYIACRKLQLKDGVTVEKGERVIGAEDWKLSVRKAHLNLGWIELEEDKCSPLPVPSDSPQAAAAAQVSIEAKSRQFKKQRR